MGNARHSRTLIKFVLLTTYSGCSVVYREEIIGGSVKRLLHDFRQEMRVVFIGVLTVEMERGV